MRPWQFGKPKTPGFGISSNYYVSVLCSTATLPSIEQIVNPDGRGGAVVGFAAPLSAITPDKSILSRPLARGAYVAAAKDRKTVLKMLVMNRDESAFNPEAYALSSLALDSDPEVVARIRATWNLAQLTFESHHPMVYPALEFFLSVAGRIATLSDGVVADPIGQRYLLPTQLFHEDRLDPRIDARDHVSVNFRLRQDGVQAFTLGMQKFELPEMEILNLFDGDQPAAKAFLVALAEKVLLGEKVRPGDQFGANSFLLEAREGGFDRALWEGVAVYELLPPTSRTAGECLRAWVSTISG